jgi:anaerobic magnesium-protoporphyrin IX monomethyl ester cyclase
MTVLLANTPYVKEKGKYGVKAGARWAAILSRVRGMQYYPFPFFMAYATSVLRNEGFEAKIRDFIAEEIGFEESLSEIKRIKPDFLVLETSTPSIYSDLDVVSKVKKELETVVILVGPHASAFPFELMKENPIDYIIPGEYEYTLKNLLKALRSRCDDLNSVKGLYLRANSDVNYSGQADLIDDLDELPYPERNDIPLYKYTDPSCKKFPNISILASRGCPKKCIFCLEPSLFYGKPNFRTRKPDKVVDEIQFLISKFKPEEIYFDDSSFTLSNKLAAMISEEIIRRNIDITWSCMADVNVDYDTLLIMKKSGCQGLKFGVESADPKILELSGKMLDLDNVRKFVSNCKKLGLYTHGTFMFGLPGESRTTINKTIEFAFSLNLTSSQFSVATPYPGTTFYEMAKKNKWLITDDLRNFEGGSTPVVSYPDCTPKDIINGINTASRKKIRNLIFNPTILFAYLVKLYKIHGPLNIITELFLKLMYVVGLKKA